MNSDEGDKDEVGFEDTGDVDGELRVIAVDGVPAGMVTTVGVAVGVEVVVGSTVMILVVVAGCGAMSTIATVVAPFDVSVVGGALTGSGVGAGATSVVTTVTAGLSEPEPEPVLSLEPDPPSIGTTRYVALGASAFCRGDRISFSGRDRQGTRRTEIRRADRVVRGMCILNINFQDGELMGSADRNHDTEASHLQAE